jgi:hypothetical protein
MADLIGYTALAIMVYALVRKDSDKLLALIGVGLLLWSLHYWLIGSMAGAVTHLIAAVGVLFAHQLLNTSLRLRILFALIFSALGVVGSLVHGITPANVVASVGCVIMTTSQYVFRGARMRQGFLVGEALFFIFAMLVGSVPGMLVTAANGIAGIIGLVRIHRSAEVPETINQHQRPEHAT